VDARRGEVFWALYRSMPAGMERLSEYGTDEPAKVAAALSALGEECVAVGDGARRYASLFDGVTTLEVAGPGYAYPSAAWLVALARPLALAGRSVTADEVAPLYLRTADVRINWEQRPAPTEAR
jgi:tRNA threonylcarbamoyladenosine biosynthesis protein TsaB